mmetsp:Transcript_74664/g.103757  ORF Transcript_74664/g.103757 Transcript_74664/m.103757 type:complete len:182 (-) Transcript_74664:478-1023(-)
MSEEAPPIGIVIPGRVVEMGFEPAGDDKFATVVESPGDVAEICMFLTPDAELPEGGGLAVFWTADGEEWAALGVLSADRPSAIFQTGWKSNAEMQACPAVQIGVSIESADFVDNLGDAVNNADDKLGFARLVAGNLWNFMGSFAEETEDGEFVVAPMNALDAWLEKFETKFRRDPEFLLKS